MERIGFIGQGYVGKNYADDFERRGYGVVRYALEEPYAGNRSLLADCSTIFVAVPTPTTPEGFDDSFLRSALDACAPGCTVVVKSTVVPGTTARLQEAYPELTLLFSPEFLSEATAADDVAHPFASVVGYPVDDEAHRAAAERVLALLPEAPFARTMMSIEAELFKYAHNASGYVQIVFFNALYDLATAHGASWAPIEEAVRSDPFIPNRYASPVHKTGRGAGGNCFVKDFAAFRAAAEEALGATHPLVGFLAAAETANRHLLRESGKDQGIVEGVYGTD